ncbi:hypothetical protein HYT84_00360 [Candidatus Micrarchaeota archaeon]|nr:hypothetical protein [Candidatus Micrarchaeota archaeon]
MKFYGALFLLAMVFISGCVSKTVNIDPTTSLTKTEQTTEDGVDLMKSDYQKIKFTGVGVVSPMTGTKCLYYEFAFFSGDTIYGNYKSDEGFYAKVNSEEVKLQLPPARLYLKPTFEKNYITYDKSNPENINKAAENVFVDAPPKVFTFKEWCILPNKTYLLKVKKESFYLPPSDPDSEPGESSATAYQISDEEYSDKEKKDHETPQSRWTY